MIDISKIDFQDNMRCLLYWNKIIDKLVCIKRHKYRHPNPQATIWIKKKEELNYKVCNICGRVLGIAEFHKTSVLYRGNIIYYHHARCKYCRNKRNNFERQK
jgi:hypothetical protein